MANFIIKWKYTFVKIMMSMLREKLLNRHPLWHRWLFSKVARHPKKSVIFGEDLEDASLSTCRKELYGNTPYTHASSADKEKQPHANTCIV